MPRHGRRALAVLALATAALAGATLSPAPAHADCVAGSVSLNPLAVTLPDCEPHD